MPTKNTEDALARIIWKTSTGDTIEQRSPTADARVGEALLGYLAKMISEVLAKKYGSERKEAILEQTRLTDHPLITLMLDGADVFGEAYTTRIADDLPEEFDAKGRVTAVNVESDKSGPLHKGPTETDVDKRIFEIHAKRDKTTGRVSVEVASKATSSLNSPTEEILSVMKQMDDTELENLVPQVIALGAERRAACLRPKESNLLARANETLPQDLKSRLIKLQKRRDNRLLSKAESEELIALSDRAEQLHAERLEALADLARLRGKTLNELMDQLGIRFPANA